MSTNQTVDSNPELILQAAAIPNETQDQLVSTLKKTPLRDLHSDSNIVPQKLSSNPLVLKEAEALKVSGTKRPSPESLMSVSHHHPSSSNAGNAHLVYVRRKSEADAGKNTTNEVVADNANLPHPTQQQLNLQEDQHPPKSLINESQMQCVPAYAPISITTCVTTIPSTEPSLGTSINNTISEKPRNLSVQSAITSSVQSRVNNNNWEERYLQLQMFLKALDQSSLEDHLQMLRSFSAVELSRHAVELEKRAIQLSLEQAKELQRVKDLNVLGKSVRTSNRPPASVEKQIPQG